MQSERRSPASRLHSSAPLHIIRRFTQYWRNDLLGIEQFSRFRTQTHYVFDPDLYERHERIAREWDAALARQDIVAAYERRRALH